MKVDVLVAEIGSTTTVVNAFKDLDTENPVFWAQGQAPTSVLAGDVRIGLQEAIDEIGSAKKWASTVWNTTKCLPHHLQQVD